MPLTRRETLKMLGAGFGMVGLADGLLASSGRPLDFPAKAKRVIFLFLNGGLSHVDTFDPKPALTKYDGQPMPGPKIKTDRASGGLMKSPFEFKPHGESGVEVSDIFPRVGSRIDDFMVVRSMWSESVNHLPSMLMMNTGHALRGGSRPSFGSWVTYGLGSENQNLPGYVVLCPGTPVGAARNWSSSFLPTKFQGALIRNDAETPNELIQDIANASYTREEQRRQLDLLDRLDASFLDRVGFDPRLESNIESHGDRVSHANRGARDLRPVTRIRASPLTLRRRRIRTRMSDGLALGRGRGSSRTALLRRRPALGQS